MEIDLTQLSNILEKEQGYTKTQIILLIKDINPLHADLESLYNSWLRDRSIVNYDLDGLSIEHLLQNDTRNFIPALGILNNLLNNEKISMEMRIKVIEHLKTSNSIDFEIDK